MAQERIQKILSRAGVSSRRKAEELIIEGAVTINGRPAKLGDKAEFGKDAIKVSGKLLQATPRAPIYLAFNKPRGVISMFADPEGRPTLEEYFRRFGERLFPVGRLDFMSEGLLLVTNDGEFAERVQKSDGIPRVYRVKVKGRPDPGTIERLARATRVDGKLVHPHSVRVVDHLTSKSLVEVVLIGAGATDLKALFERNGVLVDRITRTAIGQVALKGMEPGAYRLLRKSQADAIFSHPELAVHAIEQEQEKTERRLPLEQEEGLPAIGRSREGAARERYSDRPAKPAFSRDRAPRGDKPAYTPRGGKPACAPRGDKPAYTPRGGKPAYAPRGGKPAYAPRGDKPAYAPRGDKPAYAPRGDKPAYAPRGDKPAYSSRDRYSDRPAKPAFSRDRAPRSSRAPSSGAGGSPRISIRPRGPRR